MMLKTVSSGWLSRALTAGALATGVLAVSGCASGGPSASDSPFDRGQQTIDIEVRNLNWSDATLWANRSGSRTRLGVVPGKGERSFELRWRMNDLLYVEVDLFTGPRCVTSQLSVDPGDIIELQIPIDMRGGTCIG